MMLKGFVMRSVVLPSVRTGTFNANYTQSLNYFCTETTQKLVHPGYFDLQANWYRLISVDRNIVTIMVSPEGCIQWSCEEAVEDARVQDVVNRLLISMPLPQIVEKQLPRELEARFRSLHPLVHVGSLSLGEAVIKAVIRQVITANHAKKLTDALIRHYGTRHVHAGRAYYDFPTLEALARIPLEDLQAEGLGFKAKVVRGAACSMLENDLEAKIATSTPEEALAMLTSIKGIGRWTAHIALCDVLADWSLYPFEDLAVRTWARKLWGDVQWPSNEHTFAALWQHMHGEHTGIVTFYLLSCATISQTRQQYIQ